MGIPDIVKQVAKNEAVEPAKLARAVADGLVVIPYNPVHSPDPQGMGQGLRVKVNVNIGTSPDHADLEEELEKTRIALKYGTHALMDLSIGGNISEIRKAIIKECSVPLGTVPIYQAGLERARKDAIVNMTEDDIFNSIEAHAKDGVDFMTVHCGVNRESIEKLRSAPRVTDVVSRGGAFLTAWILHNDQENPLYANYDHLLDLAREHEFTLSLGDGLRPGCIFDASDQAQFTELMTLGRLVERARKAGVQAMVEGPGHVPMHQIESNVALEKSICKGAPFYVLGPLVTDIAPGYDHIVSAIGGAIAAMAGADFLCYVTPSEHLSLPTIQDVKEGTIASRIAAHAVDLARGKDMELDMEMAVARRELDFDRQFKAAMDPDKAVDVRENRRPAHEDTCSMCGDLCAIKTVKDYLRGEK